MNHTATVIGSPSTLLYRNNYCHTKPTGTEITPFFLSRSSSMLYLFLPLAHGVYQPTLCLQYVNITFSQSVMSYNQSTIVWPCTSLISLSVMNIVVNFISVCYTCTFQLIYRYLYTTRDSSWSHNKPDQTLEVSTFNTGVLNIACIGTQ